MKKAQSEHLQRKFSIPMYMNECEGQMMSEHAAPGVGTCALSRPEAHGVSARAIKQAIAEGGVYCDNGLPPRELELVQQVCENHTEKTPKSRSEIGNQVGRFPCSKMGFDYQMGSIFPDLTALLYLNGLRPSKGESD